METYGKICVKSLFSFEWNLPNIFSLLQKCKEFNSPEFEFCDAQWSLGVHSSPDWIDLALIKQNRFFRIHRINYKMAVINADGTEYTSIEDKNLFNAFFKSRKRRLISRSKLLEDRSKIAPNGTLTICCTIRCDFPEYPDSMVVEIASFTQCQSATRSWAIAEDTGKGELSEDKTNSAQEKDIISNENKDFGKLLRDMETLFSDGIDSDITLIVQNLKFPVHRAILGIRSSVFAAMFRHDMKEKTGGTVKITDFDPDVFHDFLLYLYTAKVEKLSWETVLGLYSAADKYNTQELKTKCVEFMRDNLSLDMFCSVVSLALQHKEPSLLETAKEFFSENFKEVILTVQWLTFMKENPVAANELLIKASNF